MSANRNRNENVTCIACHKRAAVKGAQMCQRCFDRAQEEAQLSAIHVAAMRADMNEARNG